MATLQELARVRKQDLKVLLKASRKVDAVQEILEREVKRLVTRKNAVPEQRDAIRLLEMAKNTDDELGSFISVATGLADKWRAV